MFKSVESDAYVNMGIDYNIQVYMRVWLFHRYSL